MRRTPVFRRCLFSFVGYSDLDTALNTCSSRARPLATRGRNMATLPRLTRPQRTLSTPPRYPPPHLEIFTFDYPSLVRICSFSIPNWSDRCPSPFCLSDPKASHYPIYSSQSRNVAVTPPTRQSARPVPNTVSHDRTTQPSERSLGSCPLPRNRFSAFAPRTPSAHVLPAARRVSSPFFFFLYWQRCPSSMRKPRWPCRTP